MRLFQITAPIQPGNSGGIIADESGNALGVVVAKLDAMKIAQLTRDIPQNINFGIKASIARQFLARNGVAPALTELGSSLKSTQIAEMAEGYSVKILCKKN